MRQNKQVLLKAAPDLHSPGEVVNTEALSTMTTCRLPRTRRRTDASIEPVSTHRVQRMRCRSLQLAMANPEHDEASQREALGTQRGNLSTIGAAHPTTLPSSR